MSKLILLKTILIVSFCLAAQTNAAVFELFKKEPHNTLDIQVSNCTSDYTSFAVTTECASVSSLSPLLLLGDTEFDLNSPEADQRLILELEGVSEIKLIPILAEHLGILTDGVYYAAEQLKNRNKPITCQNVIEWNQLQRQIPPLQK